MIFWFWFFGLFSGLDPCRVEWPSTLHAVCKKTKQNKTKRINVENMEAGYASADTTMLLAIKRRYLKFDT